MNRMALLGTILAILATTLFVTFASRPAAACNRLNGCTMDVLLEDQAMMRDGRMTGAMRSGQENIEAFRRQQAADQAAGRSPPVSK